MFPESMLSDENRAVTYSEFLTAVEDLGGKIKAKAGGGKKCGILCKSELDSGIAVLAGFLGGTTAVLLPGRYDEILCNRITEACEPDFVITDSSSGSGLVINNFRGDMTENFSAQGVEDDLQDVALIMYTSGTTGVPKGIMLTYDNIYSNLLDINEYFEIFDTDRILISRPLFHAAVLTGEFLISLFRGVGIVFFNRCFNPAGVLKRIEGEKITVMCGTPTLFYYMLKYVKRANIDSLRVIVSSGECMTEAVAGNILELLPNVRVYSVYGLTEASPRVAYLDYRLFEKYKTSVGIPLKSVKCRIVDDNGVELKNSVCGELAVSGPNVMKGYYRDKHETDRRIKEGWLYTGDIAVKDENGFITVKCRKDNLIIKGGMNVYPQEIENVLKFEDGIEDVVAYGVKDGIVGEKIVLKVVLKGEGEIMEAKNIFQICKKKLPCYQLPDCIEIVDCIERNPAGKAVRKAANMQICPK